MASDPGKWEPGRYHWYSTTAIALIAVVTAATSLFMNFFYKPVPDPLTIESKHSEFLQLSYADRLGICIPYIGENVDEWMEDWSQAKVNKYQPQPFAAPTVNDPNASGQQIVNLHIALGNYAKVTSNTDEGLNIYSCSLTPTISVGDEIRPPKLDKLVNGNKALRGDLVVVKESPLYYQGEFVGIKANGTASKVVEVLARPGTPEEARMQMGYSLVGGREEGAVLWAQTVWLDGDEDIDQWVHDVEHFKGG